MIDKSHNSNAQIWCCVVLVVLVFCCMSPLGAKAEESRPCEWITPEEMRTRDAITPEVSDAQVTKARQLVDGYIRILRQKNPALSWEEIIKRLVLAKPLGTDGLVHVTRESIPIGEKIAYGKEIERRFGEERNPVIRASVLKALVMGGIALRDGDARENSQKRYGCKPYPAAALRAFEELEHRYRADTHPVVRAQYARLLIEQGRVWSIYDPDTEIAAYDAVVERFGKEKELGIQAQVADALYRKADVVLSVISPLLVYELERRLRKKISFDPETAGGFATGYTQGFYADSVRKCRKTDTRLLLETSNEIARQFDLESGDPLILKKASKELRKQCREPDAQEALAIYDEIDRRFGKSKYPEIHELVVEAMLNKGRFLEGKDKLDFYDELYRRFGKHHNSRTRWKIADYFFVVGQHDLVVQRFKEDRDPIVQERVARSALEIGERLMKKGDLEAAFQHFDALVRHLESFHHNRHNLLYQAREGRKRADERLRTE